MTGAVPVPDSPVGVYDHLIGVAGESGRADVIEGAGCKFIDSRHIRDPQKQNPECGNAENWKNPDPKVNCSIQNDIDQYHFGDRLGAVWAQGVMRQIR